MLLRRLELVDLRSYERAVLEPGPGPTVIVGPNAHGKTNLLEAVHRLATGSSHRVSSDGPLVREGAEAAYIRAAIETDAGRRRTVEVELRPGQGTRAKVDGQDVRRTADAVGVIRAVMAAPEDLEVIRGDPGARRRFLDDLLAQRRPAYAATRSEYDRVLRQRNQLLRSARGIEGTPRTLSVWTERLVEHGALLVAARLAATAALRGPATSLYAELADRPEPITLDYDSSADRAVEGEPVASGPEGGAEIDPGTVAERLRAALAAVADDERQRGVTLVGPHRDELELSVRGLPARGYASHGQLWSLVLALRLAAHRVLSEVGDVPLVLLDDVFAELDEARRDRLAAACRSWPQVLVTSAVDGDVPLRAPRVEVRMEDDVSRLVPRAPVADAAGG